jgi:hypothetical protein
MKTLRVNRVAAALIALCFPPLLYADPATEAKTAITRTDCGDALRTWRDWAQKGDVGAQYFVAALYLSGQLVNRDYDEAARWLRKAAEQGLAPAEYELSLAYMEGRGVAKDDAEVVRWTRKAAEQGYAPAQHNLGSQTLNGIRGAAKDEAEGVRWFRKAAEQGWVPSQRSLVAVYFQGKGAPKDLVEAYKWASLAMEATQGPERQQTARGRDEIAKSMTQEQVEQGSQRARDWKQTGTAIYADARFARLGELSKVTGGQAVDAGSYTVPAPAGEGWNVQVDTYNDSVAFTRTSPATKELTSIVVARRELFMASEARNKIDIVTAVECSEEAGLKEQGKAKSYMLGEVSKEIEAIDGKTLYVMRYVITDRRLSSVVESKEAGYIYLPPNWKESKRAYVFSIAQPQKVGDMILATDASEVGSVIAGFRQK